MRKSAICYCCSCCDGFCENFDVLLMCIALLPYTSHRFPPPQPFFDIIQVPPYPVLPFTIYISPPSFLNSIIHFTPISLDLIHSILRWPYKFYLLPFQICINLFDPPPSPLLNLISITYPTLPGPQPYPAYTSYIMDSANDILSMRKLICVLPDGEAALGRVPSSPRVWFKTTVH